MSSQASLLSSDLRIWDLDNQISHALLAPRNLMVPLQTWLQNTSNIKQMCSSLIPSDMTYISSVIQQITLGEIRTQFRYFYSICGKNISIIIVPKKVPSGDEEMAAYISVFHWTIDQYYCWQKLIQIW